MTRKYQCYTQEFKLEAIRLMNESEQSTAQLARELGIRVNQLYNWKNCIYCLLVRLISSKYNASID